MPSTFKFSPRIANILRGRGMYNEDKKLLCSAPICVHETEHKGFGREIEVKGEAICPRCQAVAIYPDDYEDIPTQRKSILRCPSCRLMLDKNSMNWTQEVVSKHQGRKHKKHIYYHKECYEGMFIE